LLTVEIREIHSSYVFWTRSAGLATLRSIENGSRKRLG
jgi:hypothetical protein